MTELLAVVITVAYIVCYTMGRVGVKLIREVLTRLCFYHAKTPGMAWSDRHNAWLLPRYMSITPNGAAQCTHTKRLPERCSQTCPGDVLPRQRGLFVLSDGKMASSWLCV